MRKYKHLFGPVPSRRFGRSLGVDLTPHKTCSFDCIFCQLGRTSSKTLARKEYVPTREVVDELDDWLKTGGQADYITLSGSGEPTLHSGLGDVIDFVRKATSIPVVLLTNGSLLHRPEVRSTASGADIVKVSLSAWDHFSFDYINRPIPGLDFKKLIEGQWQFRTQFKGELRMEVFIVWGVNSTPKDVGKIASLVKLIQPDRTQLNTVARPPAESFAEALPREHMEELTQLFEPVAEVVGEFAANGETRIQANEDTILGMLQRRPCTARQIAKGLGLHLNEVSKHLGKLQRAGLVYEERKDGDIYYAANSRKEISLNQR